LPINSCNMSQLVCDWAPTHGLPQRRARGRCPRLPRQTHPNQSRQPFLARRKKLLLAGHRACPPTDGNPRSNLCRGNGRPGCIETPPSRLIDPVAIYPTGTHGQPLNHQHRWARTGSCTVQTPMPSSRINTIVEYAACLVGFVAAARRWRNQMAQVWRSPRTRFHRRASFLRWAQLTQRNVRAYTLVLTNVLERSPARRPPW